MPVGAKCSRQRIRSLFLPFLSRLLSFSILYVSSVHSERERESTILHTVGSSIILNLVCMHTTAEKGNAMQELCQHVVHQADNLLKGLGDVVSSLCAHFPKCVERHAPREALRLVLGNLPGFTPLPLGHVKLIAHKEEDGPLRLPSKLVHPSLRPLEAISPRYVVHQYCAYGAPVVQWRQGAIALLPCNGFWGRR